MDREKLYRRVISRSTNGRGMVISGHMHGLRYLARQVADPSVVSVREILDLQAEPGDGPLDRHYPKRLLAMRVHASAAKRHKQEQRLRDAKARVAELKTRMRRRATGG